MTNTKRKTYDKKGTKRVATRKRKRILPLRVRKAIYNTLCKTEEIVKSLIKMALVGIAIVSIIYAVNGVTKLAHKPLVPFGFKYEVEMRDLKAGETIQGVIKEMIPDVRPMELDRITREVKYANNITNAKLVRPGETYYFFVRK